MSTRPCKKQIPCHMFELGIHFQLGMMCFFIYQTYFLFCLFQKRADSGCNIVVANKIHLQTELAKCREDNSLNSVGFCFPSVAALFHCFVML